MRILGTGRSCRISAFRTALALLLCLGVSPVISADFSSWTYKMKITFAGYTAPSAAETLTNFPALVVLSTNISQFQYSYFNSASNGADLRFSDSNSTTELNYEIEKWDTNGSSYIWVQVPAIVDSNSYVFAYLGCNTNSPSYATNGATWTNGFNSVWHFGRTNNAPDLRDSSTNCYDGVNTGSTSTNGIVSYAERFVAASTQYITITNSSKYLPASNSAISVACWLKPSTISAVQYGNRAFSLGYGGGVNSALILGFDNSTNAFFYRVNTNVTATQVRSAPALSAGNWYHVALTFDGSASNYVLYINGTRNKTATDSLIAGGSALGRIGTSVSVAANTYYDGIMDELQVSSLARSSNWIWACWLNMASNSTSSDSFNRYDAVQLTDPNPPWIVNAAASNITTTSAFMNGALISTGTSATAVSLFWGTNNAGTNASNWANTNLFGTNAATPLVSYTTNIIGLSSNTTYYYCYYANNASGAVWMVSSESFMTMGPPSVDNNGGASNVWATSATLCGQIIAGNPVPMAYFCWGDNNPGGTDTNAWDYVIGVDSQSGAFSTNIAGLQTNTTYYYRCFATNSESGAWAASETNFTTPSTYDWIWDGESNTSWTNANNWNRNSGFPSNIVSRAMFIGAAANQPNVNSNVTVKSIDVTGSAN